MVQHSLRHRGQTKQTPRTVRAYDHQVRGGALGNVEQMLCLTAQAQLGPDLERALPAQRGDVTLDVACDQPFQLRVRLRPRRPRVEAISLTFRGR